MARRVEDIMPEWEEKLVNVMKGGCSGVTTEVLDETPVLSGRLKNGWTPSKNSPQTREGSGVQDYAGVINSLNPGDTYYCVNGVEYAPKIEYLGHSAKAPNGMRERAIANWQKHVDEAVRDNQ